MAGSKPISIAIIDLGEESAQRLDQLKSMLLLLGSGSMVSVTEDSFLGRELCGAAVVATMAEIERLLREYLVGLAEDVNASKTEVREVVPSLRGLVAHGNFESIANTRQAETTWSQRRAVTTLEVSSAYALLPTRVSKGAQPPLDGKTITDVHVLRLWQVLGISASPFPIPSCATSLKRLASLRNDIAHANQPIKEVFRGPETSAKDLERLIDDVQLLILNLAHELSAYARSKKYKI